VEIRLALSRLACCHFPQIVSPSKLALRGVTFPLLLNIANCTLTSEDDSQTGLWRAMATIFPTLAALCWYAAQDIRYNQRFRRHVFVVENTVVENPHGDHVSG
jgi:hypothetical protein